MYIHTKHKNQYFKHEIKVCFSFAEPEQDDMKLIFSYDFTVCLLLLRKGSSSLDMKRLKYVMT